MPTELTMPNEWSPRAWQLPALRALDRGCKRALLLWHRRAGKDSVALNWAAKEAAKQPTSILYLLPEVKQAKRVIWREIDPTTGKTHLNQAFPEVLRVQASENEGFIRLANGSIFQLGGFDTIDSYVGVGPRIVIFSEYAVSQHGQRAWNLVQPILLANKGIAIFPYTPRGKNHGFDLEQNARNDPTWFFSKQTIDDTQLIPPAEIERVIASGEMDLDYARQEFWCSFEAPNTGAYYGRQMEDADKAGRITKVDHDPALEVYTWWDIGIDDSTSIWFVQGIPGREVRCIDYYENEGEGLAHYLAELDDRAALGWRFAKKGQLVPHDFAAREFGSGMSRQQRAYELGWPTVIVPADNPQDGIDAARRVLPSMWFDRERCAKGIRHLREYRKKWSDQLLRFTGPLHDEHSHAADAFRTGVKGMRLSGFKFAGDAPKPEPEKTRWPHELTMDELIARRLERHGEGVRV